MSPVPLLVVGGYLGAGKTTLIKHLLECHDGRKLLILVNDFGAVNIDSELIAEANGETISLTNGCVCCAMTGDLFFAVGDALDRRPRPDAIVIEASGVGDPARIAAVALAEPELRHAGIVTAVDVETISDLVDDKQIGAQVRQQIAVADLVALTRTDKSDARSAAAVIRQISEAPQVAAPHGRIDPDLLFGLDPEHPVALVSHDHGAAFATWSGRYGSSLPSTELRALLTSPVEGLFRLKGWITDENGSHEVHRVGRRLQLSPAKTRIGSSLVAIGPADRFRPEEMERQWVTLTKE